MANRKKLSFTLIMSIVFGIVLSISIGLSIWIISEQVVIKPEFDANKVIINYLDSKEAYYNGNILLPSNKEFGLSIDNEDLTYLFALYTNEETVEFTEVNLDEELGPIDVGIYKIKVKYLVPEKKPDGGIVKTPVISDELTFEIKPRDLSNAEVSFNRKAGNKFDLGMLLDSFRKDLRVFISLPDENAELLLDQTKDFDSEFPVLDQTGTFTATIIGKGNFTGETTIEYIIQKVLLLSISQTSTNYNNGKYYFTYTQYTENTFPLKEWITVTTGGGESVSYDLDFEYQSSSMSSFEQLSFNTPLTAKEYSIKITASAEGFTSAEQTIVLVVEQASLRDAVVTLEKEDYIFDNTAHTPSVLSVVVNGVTLTAGLDYDTSYENNTAANVTVNINGNSDTENKAKVVVTGKGNYKNISEKEFSILQAVVEITKPVYSVASFLEGTSPAIQTEGYATENGKNIKLTGVLVSNESELSFETGESSSQTKTITHEFIPTDYNVNGISNYRRTTTTSELTMHAVAYIGSTYYGTIAKAVEAANTGTSKKVYVVPKLGIDIVIKKTLTIPSGVHLYIPYNGTSYEVGENGIKDLPTSSYSDKDSNAVKNNRVTLIRLEEDADIIINQGGGLYLGGQTRRIGVTGLYAEINLDSESMIECSGNFECYGYVKENSLNAKNSNQEAYKMFSDNSYDSGRCVSVTSTGIIKTAMAVYDFQSAATSLVSLSDAGVFPLNLFDFNCLQTYVDIENGGQFIVQSYLIATTSVANKEVYQTIPIVKTSGAMFNLTSGNCAIEYCPENSSYTSSNGLTKIYVNGTVTQGAVSISIDTGIAGTQTISTADKFIPLSYKFNVFINNGGYFDSNGYDIKFLPGSLLKVNAGGILDVSGNLIFYKGVTNTKLYSYKNTNDARLVNNGTIKLSSDAKIGAFIETEALDGSATLDFSLCANSNSFTTTAVEGETGEHITVTSEGYFVDNSDNGKSIYQFAANSIVSSDENGSQSWDGTKYALRTLTISLANVEFEHKIFNYDIYVADDANGKNPTQITSGNVSVEGEYEVADGKYVMIKLIRTKGSIFADGTSHSSETWYEVSDDMELIITPHEGVKLTVKTDSGSGNGTQQFLVSESATKDGTFIDIITYNGITQESVYLVKGYYFKIKYSGGAGLTSISSSKVTITTSDGTSRKVSIKSSTTEVLQINEDSTIYFPRSCFAEGTLITLADGTKKPVEQLTKDELILAWDFETGQYVAVPVLLPVYHGTYETNIINLVFANGTIIRIITEHGFYSSTINNWIYIDEFNYEDYIGYSFIKESDDYDNNNYSSVELVDAYITTEIIGVYSVVASYTINCYAEGMLSITPPDGIYGLFHYFDIGEEIKYDEAKMKQDIELYGLYTYDEWKEYVTKEEFDALNIKYLKVSVGKGLITEEHIVAALQSYFPKE